MTGITRMPVMTRLQQGLIFSSIFCSIVSPIFCSISCPIFLSDFLKHF